MTAQPAAGTAQAHNDNDSDDRTLARDFDLRHLSPSFHADPYPVYRALRSMNPTAVHRSICQPTGSRSQYGGSPKCAAMKSTNATVFGGTNARLG